MNEENLNPEIGNENLSDSESCKKCDDYLAGWKRAQADYANLKRDAEKEKTEYAKYANEKLIMSLLSAVDQLELAMKYKPNLADLSEEVREKLSPWIKGLESVQEQWRLVCSKIGLERVPSDGTMFDPQIHEVLMEGGADAFPNAEPGTITSTISDGWRLNGKLIRPATVVVQPQK